jgi:hypothetical protein
MVFCCAKSDAGSDAKSDARSNRGAVPRHVFVGAQGFPGATGLRMAVLAGVLAFGGLAAAGNTRAEAWTSQMQPWCALVESVFDCSYYTYRQCMMTTSGNSNYCIANPRVTDIPREQMSHSRRKRVRSY